MSEDWRDVLARPAPEVAPLLLGSVLTSTIGGQRVSVRITEVEAYGGVGEDPGSHAHKGRTPYCETMFANPGICHIHFTYGPDT